MAFQARRYHRVGRLILTALAILIFGLSLLTSRGAAADLEKDGGSRNSSLRIISLAPSNTELIYSLSAQNSLVGVSAYCNFPPACREKEIVGTFQTVNLERVARLKPDLVLLVSGQESIAEQLGRHGYKTLLLENRSLSAISENLRRIGMLTGRSRQASLLAMSFARAVEDLRTLVSPERTPQPTVFFCIWLRPLLTTSGTSFLGDAITTCGGRNIAAGMRSSYPHFSLEKLIIQNPDVIIMPAESHAETILTSKPWPDLKATIDHHVHFLPPHEADVLARPTLRVISGLAWLASKLHPELAADVRQWQGEAEAALDSGASRKINKISVYASTDSQHEPIAVCITRYSK